MDNKLEPAYQAILDGDLETAQEQIKIAVDAGVAADKILKEGLIPAMGEVGRLFEQGEYFVPEMLIAARAMKGGLEILRPLLVEADVQPAGKIVIGTVQGDLHDIGKNLVGMMLEGAGFEVIDLGTNVPPDRFVEAARDGTDLIGMSALLTTTMTNMPRVLEALTKARLRDKTKVIIGGAPVTQDFADQIGVDGYAEDASQAVKVAKALLELD